MKLYNIRLCRKDEINKFKDFVDKFWKHGHIMSKSDYLIHFQHDLPGDELSIVVAENRDTREFDGVFGYIPSSRYDNSKTIRNVNWGAIWKVRTDVDNPEIHKIGLSMLKYIIKHDLESPFASLGISQTHKRIAEGLNYKIGVLCHYYIMNDSIKGPSISSNPIYGSASNNDIFSTCEDIDIDAVNGIEGNINIYKNIDYFKGRYRDHQIFKYHFLGIFTNEKLEGIFVYRIINVLQSKVIRIIDFVGNDREIFNIYDSLNHLLQREKAEYIDCLNYGISHVFFRKLGFQRKEDHSDTIIPEYFEPFEQKNIVMDFNCVSDENLIIFKGDADQDRPNS